MEEKSFEDLLMEGADEKIWTPEQAKIREQYRKLLEEENIPQQ
jgi:hypothetical protein